jgi:hypothetical protein
VALTEARGESAPRRPVRVPPWAAALVALTEARGESAPRRPVPAPPEVPRVERSRAVRRVATADHSMPPPEWPAGRAERTRIRSAHLTGTHVRVGAGEELLLCEALPAEVPVVDPGEAAVPVNDEVGHQLTHRG